MSPMPSPDYEQQLTDRLRNERRAGFDQAADRSRAARHTSGSRPDVPDPRLLDAPVSPVMLAAMKAHRAWAERYAPWLLEEND